jgi:hypothetical protein
MAQYGIIQEMINLNITMDQHSREITRDGKKKPNAKEISQAQRMNTSYCRLSKKEKIFVDEIKNACQKFQIDFDNTGLP